MLYLIWKKKVNTMTAASEGSATPQSKSLIGSTLLVTGTCIGAGMLALPIVTHSIGFLPSVALFFVCWLVMISTGFLFLEVMLWCKGEANIITMAEKTLGPFGKAYAWLSYLFLFYCLTVAYVAASGDLVLDISNNAIPRWLAPIIFLSVFAPCVYKGMRAVNVVNALLVIGLIGSYFLFVFFGLPYVDTNLLAHKSWSGLLLPLPIVMSSFGFQGIVPSLTVYLQRDVKKIRKAIVIGTLIPFVVYLLWELLILGVIPTEAAAGVLSPDRLVIASLHATLQNPKVYVMGQVLTFCAITSSFLGVSVGLLDFFIDGFKVKKTRQTKGLFCLLMFVPPVIFYGYDSSFFIKALQFGGGIGSALLLILLPVLMVVFGRRKALSNIKQYRVAGGTLLFSFLVLCVIAQIYIGLFV
jgi:tyrosine-specific transport protein